MPVDDTIPQITEGTEFMTQAITPRSATSILVIRADLTVSLSIGPAQIGAGLFQDATTNAIAATSINNDTATGIYTMTIGHRMVSGTTSSTTFRIRLGGASASTVTVNGSGGARFFGAISKSTMTVTEFVA